MDPSRCGRLTSSTVSPLAALKGSPANAEKKFSAWRSRGNCSGERIGGKIGRRDFAFQHKGRDGDFSRLERRYDIVEFHDPDDGAVFNPGGNVRLSLLRDNGVADIHVAQRYVRNVPPNDGPDRIADGLILERRRRTDIRGERHHVADGTWPGRRRRREPGRLQALSAPNATSLLLFRWQPEEG